MNKAVALAPLILALAACAVPVPRNGPYAPVTGSMYERQVIGALGETADRSTTELLRNNGRLDLLEFNSRSQPMTNMSSNPTS